MAPTTRPRAASTKTRGIRLARKSMGLLLPAAGDGAVAGASGGCRRGADPANPWNCGKYRTEAGGDPLPAPLPLAGAGAGAGECPRPRRPGVGLGFGP